MNVGIITFQDSLNYGATLQTYALWKYVTNMGHECEIIRLYRPSFAVYRSSLKFKPLRQKKRTLMPSVRRFLKDIFCRKTEVTKEYRIKFEDFNSQINFSKPYYSVDDLYNAPPHYDLYITGSDQVWNPEFGFCMEPYFLTFAPSGSKKISYASSIGINALNKEELKKYGEWLSSYKAISVRERTAVKFLSPICEQIVVQVCDPCMLLLNNVWNDLAILPNHKKPYILLYTVGNIRELEEYAQKISQESGIELIFLCRNPQKGFYGKCEINAGPKEFIGYIKNASLVLSNSFHATLFSIILNSNYYAYVPQSSNRGSRIVDLLDNLDQIQHLLTSLSLSYYDLDIKSHDISKLGHKIENIRCFSQNYLNSWLK